jgi:hypothetical protein
MISSCYEYARFLSFAAFALVVCPSAFDLSRIALDAFRVRSPDRRLLPLPLHLDGGFGLGCDSLGDPTAVSLLVAFEQADVSVIDGALPSFLAHGLHAHDHAPLFGVFSELLPRRLHEVFVGELHERSMFFEEPVVRRRELFARLDARVGGKIGSLGDIGGVHGAEEMLEALLRRRAGRDVSGARDASRERVFLKSRGATFANASVSFACLLILGRP